MHDEERWRRRRGSFLSGLFALALAVGFLGLLVLTCGGLSVYMLAVVVAMGLLTGLHYLWWGRSLNQDVAGEREEDEVRRFTEAQDGADGEHGY